MWMEEWVRQRGNIITYNSSSYSNHQHHSYVSIPVKTDRLEKILNEAINHKEIAYIIYKPG